MGGLHLTIHALQEQAEGQQDSVETYLAANRKLNPFLRLVLTVMHEGSKVGGPNAGLASLQICNPNYLFLGHTQQIIELS